MHAERDVWLVETSIVFCFVDSTLAGRGCDRVVRTLAIGAEGIGFKAQFQH